MKEFDKSKFGFLQDKWFYHKDTNGDNIAHIEWVDKEPVEGDIYFNEERRWGSTFPYYKKYFVMYKLIGDKWIEQV